MTLFDLWRVSPQSHVFVKEQGASSEYRGGSDGKALEVIDVRATTIREGV